MTDSAGPSSRALRGAALVRWAMVFGSAALAGMGLWIGLSQDAAQRTADARGLVYRCPMHPEVSAERPGSCPICGMDLVSGIEPAPEASLPLYQCARHPAIRSNEPGHCPLDGSALVSADVPGRRDVELPPDRLRELGVVVVPAVSTVLDDAFEAPAVVIVDPAARVLVESRVSGWVARLPVATAGVRVRRGQPLLVVRSRELFEATAELVSAVRAAAVLGEPGATLRAQARARLLALGLSEPRIDQIERDGAPLTEIVVGAPRTGTVVRVDVVEGASVSPGQPTHEIADLERLRLVADLPESHVDFVTPGMVARVRLPHGTGRSWTAQVERFEPLVEPTARTRPVRLRVDASDGSLSPGAFVWVRFERRLHGIAIPRDAVLWTAQGEHVFVERAPGRFEPRRIETGVRVGSLVHVRRGLAVGERVASHAAFFLDAESALRAVGDTVAPVGDASGAEPNASTAHGAHK